MKKQELWYTYTSKNPHWLTDNVTLTPAGLKKLFDQTYDNAYGQGFANGVAVSNRAARDEKSKKTMDDLFGGRRRGGFYE